MKTLVILLLVSLFSLAQNPAQSLPEEEPVVGYFNDTLFTVYGKVGSFSAKDRANRISKRVLALANHYDFGTEKLEIITNENGYDVVYEDEIIVNVSDKDASWHNTDALTLSKTFKKKIAQNVLTYQHGTRWEVLAKQVGWGLLVIVLLGLILFYVNRLFRYTKFKLLQQKGKFFNDFNLKGYTFINAHKQLQLLVSLNAVLKWVVFAVVSYISLTLLFSIFPWTEGIAHFLFDNTLVPLKKIALALWNYLPNLFMVVVIVILFRWIIKGLRYLKTEIEIGELHIPGFYTDWANPTFHILRVLLLVFMLVLIFPYLPGSDSPVFQGVTVFAGFLFTFSSAGSLSNIFSGLILTYMRLFTIGDVVKIGEVKGEVIEKNMLVIRIRTPKNEIVSIPNSTVMSSHSVNYSSDAKDKGLILHTTVTIGYDVPWKKMHQVLIQAALQTPRVLKTPEPFVLQTELQDFYVAYQLNVYVAEANLQQLIYSDLHQNIQDVCAEEEIEIMSPHYRAVRDGNSSTIPKQ